MERNGLCVHIRDSNLIVEEVGNKAYNLSKISSIVNVPDGFVITSKAYDNFIKYNKLDHSIKDIADSFMAQEISADKAAAILKGYFQKAELESGLNSTIMSQLAEFKGPYAVRSSSIIEDTSKASFAGLFDTKLNVEAGDVPKSIKDVFSSAFNESILAYALKNGFDLTDIRMPVIVQEMVSAQKYGVCFSFTENGSNTKIIESRMYDPSGVTGGKNIPDLYLVNSKEIEKYSSSFGISSLFDFDIYDIVNIADICSSYIFPEDIEFALKDDKLYVIQLRRLTEKVPLPKQNKKVFAGLPVYPGIVKGEAFVWMSQSEDVEGLAKAGKGKILVTDFLPLEYAHYIKNFAAVITEFSGITSHPAILAREYKIPCIVGVSDATKLIENRDRLEIDGSEGDVSLLDKPGIAIKRKYSPISFNALDMHIFKNSKDLVILYPMGESIYVSHGYLGPEDYRETFINSRLREMVSGIQKNYPNCAMLDGGNRLWNECNASLELASIDRSFNDSLIRAIKIMDTLDLEKTEQEMKDFADKGMSLINESKITYDSYIKSGIGKDLARALRLFIEGYSYWQVFNSLLLDINSEYLLSRNIPANKIDDFKAFIKLMWNYEPKRNIIGSETIPLLMTSLYTSVASDLKIYTTGFTSLFSYLNEVEKASVS